MNEAQKRISVGKMLMLFGVVLFLYGFQPWYRTGFDTEGSNPLQMTVGFCVFVLAFSYYQTGKFKERFDNKYHS